MWLGKMINTLIFVMIQIQRATTVTFLPGNLIKFNENNQGFDCREDEAAMELLKLCIQETVLKSFTLFAKALFAILKRIVGMQTWKMKFRESEEIVWVLYYQMIFWFCLIPFPYIALIQPFLVYLIFKSYYVFLNNFGRKPIQSSNKDSTGILIHLMMVAQFFIQTCFVITLLVIRLRHFQWSSNKEKLCGPVKDNMFLEEPLINFIKSNDYVYGVY